MGHPAIKEQILEDLEKLSPELQRQIRDLVHNMAAFGAVSLKEERDFPAGLRFSVENPLKPGTLKRYRIEQESLPSADATPEAHLAEIRSLLADGQVRRARLLAARAASRYPDHAEISNAKRILNDGKAEVGSRGPEPNTDDEFTWLRNPPEWAHGKWVALLGREAVAVAESLAELVETVRSMSLPRQPLVHRID